MSVSAHRDQLRQRGRAFGVLAAGVLAVSLTAACSSDGGDKSSSGVVQVKLWEFFNGPDTPSSKKIIDGFNASQSKVHVDDTTLNYQDLTDKLLPAIAGGTGPDVATVATDFLSEYQAKGALENVDDFWAGGKYDAASVIVPAAVNGTKIQGHSYGVPLNFYDELLCYNKDIFSKAGVAVPKTWDEVAADASKLVVTKDGKVVQYEIALGDQTDTSRFWQPLLWNGGGGVVSQDGKAAQLSDPKTLSALNFWVDLVRNKHISPVGDQGPAAEALFNAGKAAMVPCGPWVVGTAQQAKINLGLAPMPSGPAGNFPWSGSLTWAIPKGVSPAVHDAVLQFANYWNSKASQVVFSTANGYPTTRTDVAPSDITGNAYVAVYGATDIIKNSRFYLPGVPNGTQIDHEVFIPTLQKALAGQGSVDSLFTAANQQAQDLLDKGN